jgi:hypothetical protein
MMGIAIAGLLVTSLGNPGLVEPGGMRLPAPGFATAGVASHSTGLTASLRVAAVETEAPRASSEIADRGANEWNSNRNSDQQSISASAAPEEPGGVGWIVGGVLVGTLNLAAAAAITSEVAHANSGLAVGVTVAAGVAGGVGGYFLGTLARQGNSIAKVIIVTLTVLDVLVPVVGGLMVASSMQNQGSLFGGRFTE